MIRPNLNFLPKQKDESALSWLSRLAACNALSLKELADFFFGHEIGNSGIRLSHLYDVSAMGLLLNVSPVEYICSHTSYLAIAPFVNLPNIFDTYVKGFVNSYDYLGSSRTRENWNSWVLKMCPKCLKEYGIIRESHQLKGAVICKEHNIPLHKLNVHKNSRDLDIFDSSMYSPLQVNENDTRYSDFVYALYDSPVDLDREQIHQFFVETGIPHNDKLEFQGMINALLKAFDTPDRAMKALNSFSLSHHVRITVPSGYTLSGVQRVNLIEAMHNCGTQFITHPKLLNSGFGCPYCANRDPDKEIASIISGKLPEFNAVKDSFRYDGRITLQHKCGNISNHKLIDVLRNNDIKCKTCTNELITSKQLSIENGIQSIMALGFTVLEKRVAQGNRLMKLKCDECGYVFYKTLDGFLRDPFCKNCFHGKEPDKMIKTDKVRKLFKGTREKLTCKDVETRTNIRLNYVYHILDILVRRKEIIRVRKGLYKCAG